MGSFDKEVLTQSRILAPVSISVASVGGRGGNKRDAASIDGRRELDHVGIKKASTRRKFIQHPQACEARDQEEANEERARQDGFGGLRLSTSCKKEGWCKEPRVFSPSNNMSHSRNESGSECASLLRVSCSGKRFSFLSARLALEAWTPLQCSLGLFSPPTWRHTPAFTN